MPALRPDLSAPRAAAAHHVPTRGKLLAWARAAGWRHVNVVADATTTIRLAGPDSFERWMRTGSRSLASRALSDEAFAALSVGPAGGHAGRPGRPAPHPVRDALPHRPQPLAAPRPACSHARACERQHRLRARARPDAGRFRRQVDLGLLGDEAARSSAHSSELSSSRPGPRSAGADPGRWPIGSPRRAATRVPQDRRRPGW